MSTFPGHRHFRAAARINSVPDRWRVATKTAITSIVLLGGSHLAGDLGFGMLASLGAFTVLYGAAAPARYRLKLLTWVAVGLVASVAVGAVTAHLPWIDVLAMAGTAAVATFLCVSLRVGPPGAVFFVLVHGVAGLASLHGTPTRTVVLAAAVGAVAAVIGGMSDLIVDPRGPERRAVEGAEAAITAFESETDRARLTAVRSAASAALHRGWTVVTDAGGGDRFTSRLWDVQARYVAASARVTGAELGVHPSPWGSPAGAESSTEEDDALDPALPVEVERRIESEQIWDTSLGRPAAGPVLRRALQWPSESLVVVGRVLVATLVAGCIARFIAVEHTHWTVAFATLILHQGGTRDAQTVRGIQRLVGTILGLGMFLLVEWWGPQGWALILLVAGLQFYVEMLVVSNYALAVVGITPLALTIGKAASGEASTGTLAGERALDTSIAIVVAFLTLYTVGRSTGVAVLRAYARQVVLGIEAVLADLAAGRIQTGVARENRRRLYFSLLESEEVARRTHADDPAGVGPYREMEGTLSHLGYVVLGLAWHPDTRRARTLADRAEPPLSRILAHSVRSDRPADDIHDDVRDLQSVVTGWRREEDGPPSAP